MATQLVLESEKLFNKEISCSLNAKSKNKFINISEKFKKLSPTNFLK